MLLTKTFVCLPDGTVVSGKSKKLRRLVAAERSPEVLAVTVTADQTEAGYCICDCEANRVVPVHGGVLVRRSYDGKVVPLPGTGPVLDVGAFERLIGYICGVFVHRMVMDAYYHLILPALAPFCLPEVFGKPHLGPCVEETDSDAVLAAVLRHAEQPVAVELSSQRLKGQVPLSRYLMWLDTAEITQAPGEYLLCLLGDLIMQPDSSGGRRRAVGQNMVALPYLRGKIFAEVYPDGVTVYSHAADLILDLVEVPAGRAVPASQHALT